MFKKKNKDQAKYLKTPGKYFAILVSLIIYQSSYFIINAIYPLVFSKYPILYIVIYIFAGPLILAAVFYDGLYRTARLYEDRVVYGYFKKIIIPYREIILLEFKNKKVFVKSYNREIQINAKSYYQITFIKELIDKAGKYQQELNILGDQDIITRLSSSA